MKKTVLNLTSEKHEEKTHKFKRLVCLTDLLCSLVCLGYK